MVRKGFLNSTARHSKIVFFGGLLDVSHRHVIESRETDANKFLFTGFQAQSAIGSVFPDD
jgi:hypothetical protein